MKMETVTSKTKKTIDNNFNKIQLEIHPSIVSFFTTFKKDRNDRLSAYVAPVNHNVLNEATAYQIIHTSMEITAIVMQDKHHN
jgi:hypothetical protein